jgi:hypothetical protein
MKARDNPFRTDRILNIRYRFRQGTLEALMEKFASEGYRASITGPEGSGKTTLMEDMEPGLAAHGFKIRKLTLDRTAGPIPRKALSCFISGMTSRDMILLDGAEQMGRLSWLRFKHASKRAGGLLITSHKAGMLPAIHECAPSPDTLDWILEKLLDAGAEAARPAAQDLYQDHGGNLREVLRALYDMYANLHFSQDSLIAGDGGNHDGPSLLRKALKKVAMRDHQGCRHHQQFFL